MTPAETEKALRDLFKKLRSPARAIWHFPTPRGLWLLDLLQGGAGARVLWQGSAQGVQENLPRERPVATKWLICFE